MGIFRALTEKPWIADQSGVDNLQDGGTFALSKPALGLRVFMAVISVIFFLLLIAYGERMTYEDWRPAPQQSLLWLNTALLVLSSIGMQWAVIAARQSEREGVRIGLIGGGVFAAAFLIGQVMAWQQLNQMVVFDIRNPAIAFFLLLTALHGLHLLGGLAAWCWTAIRLWGGAEIPRVRKSVELCAGYWHFLLVLWLVLFVLLFSGNDNLGVLLALCGLR